MVRQRALHRHRRSPPRAEGGPGSRWRGRPIRRRIRAWRDRMKRAARMSPLRNSRRVPRRSPAPGSTTWLPAGSQTVSASYTGQGCPSTRARALPRQADSVRRVHHGPRARALRCAVTAAAAPRAAAEIRRQQRILEIERDAREVRRRRMHELKQFRAGLLFRRINVLVALHDVDIDGQLVGVRR